MVRRRSSLAAVLSVSFLIAVAAVAVPVVAQRPNSVDPSLFAALRWRMIGPYRGGRSISVAGVPGDSRTFYFGAVGGSVWKTENAGRTWKPVMDAQPVSSIGAVAVAVSSGSSSSHSGIALRAMSIAPLSMSGKAAYRRATVSNCVRCHGEKLRPWRTHLVHDRCASGINWRSSRRLRAPEEAARSRSRCRSARHHHDERWSRGSPRRPASERRRRGTPHESR